MFLCSLLYILCYCLLKKYSDSESTFPLQLEISLLNESLSAAFLTNSDYHLIVDMEWLYVNHISLKRIIHLNVYIVMYVLRKYV